MKKIGIIGLGDMGLGMARNIVKNGFELSGFDLREERLSALAEVGGRRAASVREVGEQADVVFVMVLNGSQVNRVVLDEDGLLASMKPGSTLIISATIRHSEIKQIEAHASAKGIAMIDTPVNGGRSGADAGKLLLMVAAKQAVFEQQQDVLCAVGDRIFHVGEDIGMGQNMKASLQALIGALFTGLFEALVLGAKAGVSGEKFYEVIKASSIGCPLLNNTTKLIMDRQFKDTGSQIVTMHKDLGISMDLATENGVAMLTTSAAFELFKAGKSMFPDEDNWSIIKLLEQMAGTEVHW